MGGKPEWLKNLERTKETKEEEAERQSQEKANRQRILSIDGPKLWTKVFNRLHDIGNGASSGGMRVSVDSQPSGRFISIQVHDPSNAFKVDGVLVTFDPQNNEIRCEPLLQGQTRTFALTVDAGRIVLFEHGKGPIQDTEDIDKVEELCRRILEPVFSRYI
jgi:hypothetical protein